MSFEILVLTVLVFLLSAVYAGMSAAPWAPTRAHDVGRFLKLAQIRSGQKMYDLGCGDGRLVCAAARADARAEGLEISLLPYFISWIRGFFCRNGRVKIRFRSFWTTSLGNADIVYCFLMPKALAPLKEKFEKELKPGTKVISYAFPIKGWTPTIVATEPGYATLYLYEVKYLPVAHYVAS